MSENESRRCNEEEYMNNKDYSEVRGLCARALRRETRLTVYPARSVLTSEIEFREDFSHDLEVLGASKIGLRCKLSYGMSKKVREF